MNIKIIKDKCNKPELYDKGTSVMWTDPHISKQLLEVHLNKDLDLASRKHTTITSTVEWILSQAAGERLSILDLGCGPGLYCEQYAEKGHAVSGVDFSKNSIDYASKQANKKKLDINYINANYLELEMDKNQFDLVTLIFTDFGPLLPAEQNKLLQFVYKVLKPGGIFIFDVLSDKNIERMVSPRSWEVSETGFWKNRPYIAFSESFLYPDEKVVCYQHTVIDEDENIDSYRFWAHFFSNAKLEALLLKTGFKDMKFFENLIPSGDGYENDDVVFCIAKKPS